MVSLPAAVVHATGSQVRDLASYPTGPPVKHCALHPSLTTFPRVRGVTGPPSYLRIQDFPSLYDVLLLAYDLQNAMACHPIFLVEPITWRDKLCLSRRTVIPSQRYHGNDAEMVASHLYQLFRRWRYCCHPLPRAGSWPAVVGAYRVMNLGVSTSNLT